MPRTTNFVLTQEQEEKLKAYLKKRYESLQQDNDDRIKTDKEAWDRYNLDVQRRRTQEGMIWRLCNVPVPVYAMVMEHFVSRCEDTTTGEKPYFHFEAVGTSGETKALLYNRYFNWKLDEEARVHDAFQEGQLANFIQKAAFKKAVLDKKVAFWTDRDKRVLFDRASGQPIEIAGHGPIIEGEDQFTQQLDPAAPPPEPGQPPVTRAHLNADPTFVLDQERHEYRASPVPLKRSQIIYQGPKSENIPYDRLLIPSDAESSESADIIIEAQNRSYTWFYDNWVERQWANWDLMKAKFLMGDSTPKVEKDTKGERPKIESRDFDTINPVRKVLECWVRRDVMGTAENPSGTNPPQEFVTWYDPESDVIVGYEWQAKVCPDMKRPYTVVAIRKTPNRWWGKSIWEVGKEIFDAIDRHFNGEFYRTLQQANPPKGGDPTVAEEEPEDIGFDPVKYWKLKSGHKIDELLGYAKVPDTNQRTQMLVEYLIYWIQLWLGISNLAQGDYQAVNTNTTKYGIQKTLSESSMLGRRWIRRVISAYEEHLTKLVQVAITTLPANAQETFEFSDKNVRLAGELNTAEARSLTVHCSLVMSQDHEEKDIERAKAASGVLENYFEQLNPEVREHMRPLMIEILTDLGYKTAEDMLPITSAIPVNKSMLGGEPLPAAKAIAQGALRPDSPVPLPAKDEPEGEAGGA